MSTSPSQLYQYTALNNASSFRLLKLKPAQSNDDPLECELQTYELGLHFFPPEFDAISYVWGSNQLIHKIYCNGKILHITDNLNDVLYRLRKRQCVRFLWVDAICINQSNQKERKMQVALMRNIFNRARNTLVCLRLDNATSVKNRRTLCQMLRGVDTSITLPSSANYKSSRSCKLQSTPDPSPWVGVPSSFWPFLAEFFDNPWFSRIWVIQEVFKNSRVRVLVEDEIVPWQNVANLAQWLLSDAECGGHVRAFTTTNGIRNILFMDKKAPISANDPIPALLQSVRDFRASDPRDKVYAMLHMPVRRARAYTKFRFIDPRKYGECLVQSISFLVLLSFTFTNSLDQSQFGWMLIAIGCLAYFLRFDLLVRAVLWDFYQRELNFCSKVARIVFHKWQLTDTICEVLALTADYSLTTSSVYSMVATRLIERSQGLSILSYVHHGQSIDTTYPSWVPRWDVPANGLSVLVALPQHQYRSSAGIRHNLSLSARHGDHLMVEGIRFSVVSSLSQVVGTMPSPRHRSVARQLSSINSPLGHRDKTESRYPTDELLRRAQMATVTAGQLGNAYQEIDSYPPGKGQSRFDRAAQRICRGRRHFVAENGYIGVGPAAMLEGDIVCVLFGGCVPYILRSTDTEDMYRLVGESYVHGIMQGEAIDLWRQGSLIKDRFTLC